MREIKFRAWDGSRIRYDITGFEHGEGNRMEGVFIDGDYYDMKETPVMQCTGLKDKNGKEIYEGDVCEIEGGGEKTFVGEIVFEYGCFCFKPNGARLGALHPELKYYVDMEFCEIEVIGNIYENPDLLNEPVRNLNKLD